MLPAAMPGPINGNPNPASFWPWAGNVREQIIERNQLVDRKKRKGKTGDPKNPPLASSALLEFMGPGRTSEELRFPAPLEPRSGEARLSEQGGLEAMGQLLDRAGESANQGMARELARLSVPPDRLERLKGLIQREAAMLQVMGRLQGDLTDIHRRIQDESKTRGY